MKILKKIKKPAIKWIVWNWNSSFDQLEDYDVMPYFIRTYKALKKKDRPATIDDLSKWLDTEAHYMFWAKCEYEIIVHGWPMRKNDEKVDIYRQLRLNWDVFVKYFWDNVIKIN